MGINNCSLCWDKQRKIDELEDEVDRLKRALGKRRQDEKQGFFGSSTPSSKLPVKANVEEKEKKPKGGRVGHNESGRKSHEAPQVDRVVEVEVESELCPECGNQLDKKGVEERSVLDTPSTKPERVLFRLAKRYCPHCHKNLHSSGPWGPSKKSLWESTDTNCFGKRSDMARGNNHNRQLSRGQQTGYKSFITTRGFSYYDRG